MDGVDDLIEEDAWEELLFGEGLQTTLKEYFGYSTFREGQLDVIQAILGGSDAAVFWATGMGKSLCYQIPALHTKRVAFVISPLISLMQDQCNKLNSLATQPIATYLGSSQTDPTVEQRALQGDRKAR